jgi:hypothetical protein
MKNQLKYIALILAVFIGSCVDEEKNPVPDFTRSSIPVFTPDNSDTGFIDFLDPQTSHISFSVDKKGTEAVQNIDVTITFNNSQTGASNTVTLSTVSSLPQGISLTFDELLAQFPSDVVTADTLDLGDSFVVNGNVLLADGRYLTAAYSPSVISNDPVLLTYNVACASNLAGTYDLTLVSGDNGEVSSLTNQTITQVSPGYYEISDMTMDIFGPNFPVKYRFTDICGNLTADVGSVDYGTQITVKLNPGTTIDPVTGEITFAIEYISPSCCGLQGIKTVFKATPK